MSDWQQSVSRPCRHSPSQVSVALADRHTCHSGLWHSQAGSSLEERLHPSAHTVLRRGLRLLFTTGPSNT